MIDFSSKQLFLFDMDGVLIRGKEHPVRIGGSKILPKLRKQGKTVYVLTNDSTDSVGTIHRRLVRVGLVVERDEILTSARLTAEYVLRKYGKASYFLVGESGLDDELRRVGLSRTEGHNADVVVIGLDRRLTYERIDRAVKAVLRGADIVACHAARLYMSGDGLAASVGPILKAIENGSGKRGVVIGKPSPLMFKIALDKAGCAKGKAVMVGDQEDTDIAGATKAGIDSVIVLSGVAKETDATLAKARVKNVDELADYL